MLSDREPLRVAELAVSVLEAGYDTIMDQKAFRHAIDTELKAGERFVCEGGKWRVKTIDESDCLE